MDRIVFIRCDANERIGRGHLTRCLVLADELRESGYKITFLRKDKSFFMQDVIIKSKYKVEHIDEDYNIIELAKKNLPILFIADIPEDIPYSIMRYLKQQEIVTVSIDSTQAYSRHCDLCFFPQHAKVQSSLYRGNVHVGIEYTLIRPDFFKDNNSISVLETEKQSILVMMGGTDPKNLTYDVTSTILKLTTQDENIIVLLPKGHTDYEKVKSLSSRVTLCSDVENMPALLKKVKLSIVHFGTSVYEMLISAIPSILICSTQDDIDSAKWFEKKGYATVLKLEEISSIDKYIFPNEFIPPRLKKANIIKTIQDYLVAQPNNKVSERNEKIL